MPYRHYIPHYNGKIMEEEKTTPKAMRRSQLHDCTNADVQSEYPLKKCLGKRNFLGKVFWRVIGFRKGNYVYIGKQLYLRMLRMQHHCTDSTTLPCAPNSWLSKWGKGSKVWFWILLGVQFPKKCIEFFHWFHLKQGQGSKVNFSRSETWVTTSQAPCFFNTGFYSPGQWKG